MTSLAPSAKHLGARIRSLREKLGDLPVVGFHAAPKWAGPRELPVDGRDYVVAPCASGLAVREALVAHARTGVPTVILTDRPEGELGADVLARFAKGRLLTLDGWQAVKDMFRARELDPRLVREAWMPEVLIDLEPPGGFPPVPAGVLDADTAWNVVIRGRLNLAADTPSVESVLRWTMDEGNLTRWAGERSDLRVSCSAWIERKCEAAADTVAAIFKCVEAGNGSQVVPIGLVLSVLFHEGRPDDPKLRDATIRIESMIGGMALDAGTARRWATAAETIISQSLEAHGRGPVKGWLEAAESVLGTIRAAEFAQLSSLLPTGLAQRLDRFGSLLTTALQATPVVVGPEVESAAGAVLAHRMARSSAPEASGVEMALRLARWIASTPGAAAGPGAFEDAVRGYYESSSFVDWARNSVWDEGQSDVLREAYRELLARVEALRESENRRFAELLVGWSEIAPSRGALLPIERVLDEVVVPVAKSVPVLLLVLDGMSCAVFQELLCDLTKHGWDLLVAADRAQRGPVVAALPTVTEMSRTSLLCGRLCSGAAADEKEGFTSHAGLRTVSKAKKPAELFHKADLRDERGPSLVPQVRAEIADPERRVVGIVLNAIDDWLDKGDQIRPVWDTNHIKYLDAILHAAWEAERAVVLTSDHGHVIERGTEGRTFDTGGERWRLPTGTMAPAEFRLRGPRVIPGDIVAPWSENLRYGMKKHGYHGGVTPQEVVVPLAVLRPLNAGVVGWSEAPVTVPTWWLRQEAPRPVVQQPAPKPEFVVPPATKKAKGQPHLPLTVGPVAPASVAAAAAPAPAATGPAWIDRLLASETFAAQVARNKRAPVEPGRVRRILELLDERGGRVPREALAMRLGLQPVRLGGVLTALRRILNVEGYAVLEVDEDSGTVILNAELLRTQFG